MHKQIPHMTIVCFAALFFMGCATGFKTFSVDEKSRAQPAPGLDTIKISCISREYQSCVSIQYILRAKYHMLDVMTARSDETDRFIIKVTKTTEGPSYFSAAWKAISYASFAIIPAVFSEERIYHFTITSPAGESAEYEYKYTERTYSWLPLFIIELSHSSGFYSTERTSIYEEKIIPRLMTDAGPFLLSKMTKTDK